MHNTLETMKRAAFPRLNHYPYTFDDVQRIARRERIKLSLDTHRPDILGYFGTRQTAKQTRKFIVINADLNETNRTFVGLHELAHYFLHVPMSPEQWFYCRRMTESNRQKHDCEADTFALVAMIPLWMLIEFSATDYRDIPPEMQYLCRKRKALWEKWQM